VRNAIRIEIDEARTIDRKFHAARLLDVDLPRRRAFMLDAVGGQQLRKVFKDGKRVRYTFGERR